jgi:hypothetical protein
LLRLSEVVEVAQKMPCHTTEGAKSALEAGTETPTKGSGAIPMYLYIHI